MGLIEIWYYELESVLKYMLKFLPFLNKLTLLYSLSASIYSKDSQKNWL